MVDEAYADRTEWIKKSIRTTAKVRTLLCTCRFLFRALIKQFNNQMGKFSSDRAIQDYAQEYWNIESVKF
jgi:glycogen phosphorylase